MKAIEWNSKQINLSDIDPTPNNYKIKTDLGKERLQQSLKMFGLAGTVIVNPVGKRYTLIDGNSRLEEEKTKGRKKIWVSLPNRKLTPQEFKQMSAMFDFAKAGEVDMERIEKDLGTSKDFFNTWKLVVPMELLDKIGKAGKVEVPEPTQKQKRIDKLLAVDDKKESFVQLFFDVAKEKQFRKDEIRLMKKFKTDNTTDTVLAAYKYIK